LLEQNHSLSRVTGFFGLLFGVAAHSNLGAVFGMLHGREFWYGPYMPIYFIVSAMMSGGAAIIFFTCFAWMINPEILNERKERAIKAVSQLTVMLISIIMFFTVWKIISGIVAPEKFLAIKAFVAGPYASYFWIGEIGLGLVIPLILLVRSKGMKVQLMFVATGMMLVGIFFMRYDLVLAGQIVPVFHALHVEEYSSLLTYAPSFHEIAIVTAGLALAGVAFILGEKILNGHQFQKHEIVPPGGFICPGCGGIHYKKEGETSEEALKRHHRMIKTKSE
jgi:molybdopterin-containing oxidoreductase family membrane subunit